MKTNNRRDFLKKSIMGLSGTALLASGTSLDASGKAIENTPATLPTRPLGKTGIHTPLISMGASGVTSPGLVKAAYESGVKLFFSANYYAAETMKSSWAKVERPAPRQLPGRHRCHPR